jgi:hypothetical protein
MAQQVVDENEHVETVTYTLPNKHYIPVDMHYIGVENVDPLSLVSSRLPAFSLDACALRHGRHHGYDSAHEAPTMCSRELADLDHCSRAHAEVFVPIAAPR